MTALEALLLGALQGATEFLPVSSSGHLVLVEHLLGVRPSLAFNAALHAGTLAAVLGFYRRDLGDMIRQSVSSLLGLVRGRSLGAMWSEDHATRLALLIVLATVPTGIIGLGLKGPVERSMEGGLFTCFALLVTGALLLVTRWAREAKVPSEGTSQGGPPGDAARAGPTRVGVWVALAVGVAQGIAVFPGISRSGATIAAILLFGIGRADGARFCFLLSVPAILGALLLEGRQLLRLDAADLLPVALGVGAAMVVGYLSLALLVALIRRGRLHLFAAYVVPLAVLGILYFTLR